MSSDGRTSRPGARFAAVGFVIALALTGSNPHAAHAGTEPAPDSTAPPITGPTLGVSPPKECGPPQPAAQLLQDAAVVFVGSITGVDVPEVAPTGSEATIYTFAVERVFKGVTAATTTVYALPPSNPSGMGNVVIGGRYLVFTLLIEAGNPFRPTGAPDNSLYSSVCQGVLPLGKLDAVPALLGSGTAAAPDPDLAVPTTSAPEPGNAEPAPRDWKPGVTRAAIALAGVGIIARLLSLRIPGRRRRVVR